MYLPASKYLDEPAHTRSLIDASAFLTVVRHSSMEWVLLYLSMFSGFKPNRYEPWHGISNNVVFATSKASDQLSNHHDITDIF